MAQAVRTPWFTFITQNVQALPLMTQSHVVEDVERTAEEADLFAFQEIFPERYEDAVRDLNTPKTRTWVPNDPSGGCALGWPRRYWSLVDRGKVQLHESTAEVSDDRFLVWALLRHAKTGAPLLVFTFHYAAGAWNDEVDPNEAARQPLWHQDVAVTRAFLKPYVDRGIPCLGGGDANRHHNHDRGPFLGERLGRRTINYVAEPFSIDPIVLIHGKEWRWAIDPEGYEYLTNRHSDHGGRKSRQRLVYRKSVDR